MANNQPPVLSVPVNIPPLESFEQVRQVLAHLVSAINAALATLPETSFNGQRLTRIGTPVSVDDAATKSYVDDSTAAARSSGSIWGGSTAFPIAVNVVPKSGGGGRLVPSSISDNGTTVKIAEGVNATGTYSFNGVAGHGTTVTYVNLITTNTAGDVTGVSFGTSTYSGGIFVGNT